MECLVTGASRGIGWAVAQKLAAAGHNVILSATNKEVLEQRLKELPNSGSQTHKIWVVDFSAPLAELNPDFRVDLFVNASGIARRNPLIQQSIEDIEEVLQVDLVAAIVLTKAVVAGMVKEGKGGHIIHFSSVLAFKGVPGTSIYSAAKAGIDGFVRSLAREVGGHGIRVNSIAPGLVDTDMGRRAGDGNNPFNVIQGMIPPESIADSVLFLAENKNITGAVLHVDNGFTV